MDNEQRQLEIKALGRHIGLGQLYDASKSLFRNDFLFHSEDIRVATKEITQRSTDFEYREVRSLEDRASTLEVSASLSVSILSGIIKVAGYGSYLNRSDESSQTIAITAVARIRTEHKYLDPQGLTIKLSDQDIKKIGTTHVVTGITYGGNAVGSITEKKTKTNSQKDMQGSFNLEAFKGMTKVFGAKGKAGLSDKQRDEMDKYDVNVNYMTDFELKVPLPTTPTDLIDLVKRSPEFVGTQGVPCDIILTPLSRLIKSDLMSKFRELEDADLKSLADFYDRIINLQVNCRDLREQLEKDYKQFFPTLTENCLKREEEVNKMVSEARKMLRTFLETYRSQLKDRKEGEKKETMAFIEENEPKFNKQQKLYEEDSATFEDLLEKKRAADEHKFKLIPIKALSEEMHGRDQLTISLILIPESVGMITLLNMYRLFARLVKKWQEDKLTVNPTVYYSFYVDPKIITRLRDLDDKNRTLEIALRDTERTKEPTFLTFGVSRGGGHVRELRWDILNHEGWGVLTNKKEGWRYIGAVHKKLPHGVGTITYCDGTTYHGDWVQGLRDGNGKLTKTADQNQVIAEGVFIDNKLRKDGIVLEVRVYKDHSIIDYAPIALRKGDAATSHVMKIARVFGFISGRDYRVNLKASGGILSIRANGSLINDTDASDVESSWPLDGAEIEIEI